MSKDMTFPAFAQLFSLYRAQSRLVSLAQFSSALAELGLVLDASTFSHWQRGNRAPHNRITLLKVIKTLMIHQGIRRVEDANQLLASVGQPELDPKEEKYLRAPNEVEPPLIQRSLKSTKKADQPNDLEHVFNLVLPADFNQFIEKEAKELRVSKATIIRQIIQREMERE